MDIVSNPTDMEFNYLHCKALYIFLISIILLQNKAINIILHVRLFMKKIVCLLLPCWMVVPLTNSTLLGTRISGVTYQIADGYYVILFSANQILNYLQQFRYFK